MTTAAAYARALESLVEKTPTRSKEFLKNLHTSLQRRGHNKLLPQIVSEYEKLELQKKRSAQSAEITLQMEQTRILLQLYRKLIEAK